MRKTPARTQPAKATKATALIGGRRRGVIHPVVIYPFSQPSDSSPHDDHFHVRLYCAPDDLPYGCADRPPIWC